ncbi:MAG: glycosyltransferase family 39 protein [Candidatus Thorarchaeota archaeon]|nr:glycosyltransferase family 39 protein [Candidatus Thorarchaeota archaeon]
MESALGMTKLKRFKRSSERFLKQVFHKPKAKISRGSVMIVVTMTIVFFSSLALRLLPMINAQPIVRAFDPWFQLKVTRYITENGYGAFFSWYDDTSWVPFGHDITTAAYVGVPFTSAFLYFAANALGLGVDVTFVSIVMPALLGAITTIVAFFLGRELYNNTVGMLSALFMGYMPAFLQRTVVGFFDNECVGVLAIVLGLFFFVRALKRDSLASAVGAGVSVGYLLASWGASDFLIDLFAMYAFLMLIAGKYSRRLLSTYTLTMTIGFFIGCLVPRNSFDKLTTFSFLVPIGVGVLLAGFEIWTRIGGYRETTAAALSPHMKPLLLSLIMPAVAVSGYFIYANNSDLTIRTASSNPFLTLGGKFLTVINPFYRLDQRIFASVAEHLPSPWSTFYNTLLVLIFFFPLGMYFLFKRGHDEDWLILLYGLTSVYFTGSMIRLGLILAPGVAVLAAVAVNNILSPFAKIVTQSSVFERRRFRVSSSLTSEQALITYGFIAIVLSMAVLGGVNYTSTQVGRPEFASGKLSDGAKYTDWQTAMNFVRNVLPPSATIASWWDYGYWINSAGDGRTIVDNSTHNRTQIALMGYAMMALNLTESLRVFRQWNTTHVLVYWGHRISGFGGDEGKWPWMVRIAEDRFGSSMIDDATYLGDNPNTPDTVETEYTQDAFFQSTIYKLMLYGEPRSEQEANNMGLSDSRKAVDFQGYFKDPDTRWVENIPTNLHNAFKLVHVSAEYGLVKIYEIDYTLLDQALNRSAADWKIEKDSLSDMSLDGSLSTAEKGYSSYDVIFGGDYKATVYTRSNGTHMYYGIKMDSFDNLRDSLGIQIAPLSGTTYSDIRAVNYDGHDAYDGHVSFDGSWNLDSTGATASEFAYGKGVVEFLVPLNATDTQDVMMEEGMNYRIRLFFWNNINIGEPTYASDWNTFWVPIELY